MDALIGSAGPYPLTRPFGTLTRGRCTRCVFRTRMTATAAPGQRHDDRIVPLLPAATAARGPRVAGPRRGRAADAPADPRGRAGGAGQRVPAADGRRGGAAGD